MSPFGPVVQHPFPKVPVEGDCPHSATTLVLFRMCPCQTDLRKVSPRKIKHVLDTHVVAGLAVVQVQLCDEHLEYFTEYLHYPMVCPGCGVAFSSWQEILTAQEPLT